MHLTIFQGKGDTYPDQFDITWDQLLTELGTSRPTSCQPCRRNECPQKEGRLFTPGSYKPNTTRGKANVESISFLVYDIDHKTDDQLAQLDSILAPHDLQTCIYSTHSDIPEDRCFRLLLNLSRSVTPSEWSTLYFGLAQTFGIEFDDNAKDISRMFYLPSTPEGNEYFYNASGTYPIDVELWLQRLAASHTVTQKDTSSNPTASDGTSYQSVRADADSLPIDYSEFLKRVKKKHALKEDSPLFSDIDLARWYGRALNGEALETQGRDDALTRLIASLMYTFGTRYTECIKTLLHPSCVAMGDDTPGVTYVDLLEYKLDRIKPAVDEAFAKREASYKAVLQSQTAQNETVKKTGDDVIDLYNSKYFAGWNAEKTQCVYWVENEGNIVSVDEKSIRTATSHIKKRFDDGKKAKGFDYWREHPDHRHYEQVLFQPMQEVPSNQYNLFKGYAVKPKEGDWSKFREFWLNVICAGDESIYQYMYTWVAQLIQRPYELSGTAIILYSKTHGTGKGTFAHTIGRILGDDLYITDCQFDSIFGQFTGHLETALLVNIDESEGSLTRKQRDSIKHAITETRKACERKGYQRYYVDNYSRYILTTNNKDSAHIDPTDRRQVVVQPSACRVGDRAYFDALYKAMTGDLLSALLYDLLEYDLDGCGINLRDIPDTKIRQEMRELSLSEVAAFWRSQLILTTTTTIHLSTLHQDYTATKPYRVASYHQFVEELKTLCPSATEQVFESAGNRRMVLELSTIEQARKDFEQATNTKPVWVKQAAPDTWTGI